MRRRSRKDMKRAARATRLQHRARKPAQPQPVVRARRPERERVAIVGNPGVAAALAMGMGIAATRRLRAAEPGEESAATEPEGK